MTAIELFDAVPFESTFRTRGDIPAAASSDPDGSPWVRLSARGIAALADGVPPA